MSIHAKLLQSCQTLCNPVDCSIPGSFVHGVLQARILEWVAMPSSRESSWPRDRTCVLQLLYCRQILYCLATRKAPSYRYIFLRRPAQGLIYITHSSWQAHILGSHISQRTAINLSLFFSLLFVFSGLLRASQLEVTSRISAATHESWRLL